MKKITLFFTGVPAIAMMIGASEVMAQGPKWAMDGAGCVPTDKAIQGNLYVITAGRIKFRDNTTTGSITVICPVSVGVGSANSIYVSYRDSTGRKDTAGITVALRRIRKSNGAVETVQGLVFKSDKINNGAYNYARAGTSSESGHALDDRNYYYFVQATLVRKSVNEIVEFGGVELTSIVF